MLQLNLEKIFDLSVNRELNNKDVDVVNKKMLMLKKLIKKHQELIAHVKNIDDLINVIVFFVMATCVIQIVFLWFQITLVKYLIIFYFV